MEVALLRLPPVDASFWAAWDKVHPDSAEEARQAYRVGKAELTFEPAISTVPDLLGRSRTRGLARITSDPPGAAGESRCWQMLIYLPNPLVGFGYDRVHSAWDSPVVASWPLLCPWQPELACSDRCRRASCQVRVVRVQVPRRSWA